MENQQWSSYYYNSYYCSSVVSLPSPLGLCRTPGLALICLFSLYLPLFFFSLLPSILLSGLPLPHILLRFPIRPEGHLFLSLTLFRETSFDCSPRFLSLPIFDIHTAR